MAPMGGRRIRPSVGGPLRAALQLRDHPNVFFAGQISGVEGYVESIATGLAAGLLDFPTADLARYTGADFALTGFPTANFTLTGFMASSSTTMGSVAAWSWSLP